MKLYKIGVRGGLSNIKKASFDHNEVYMIDDLKNIYLWFGLGVSANHKDASIKKAKKLKKDRENKANIQIMNQDEEYGAFLALMDLLRKDTGKEDSDERRAELEIEYDDTLELLDIGLEPDFEADITIDAQKLADEGKSYKELCEMLAEIQLSLGSSGKKPTKKAIQEKTAEILHSSTTYEEVCWLISELRQIKNKDQ